MTDTVGLEQKIENFQKAFRSLRESVEAPITEDRDLAGIIQNFEFCYELGWKALKAHLSNNGVFTGPAKDVFKKAYQNGILKDEALWLDIIKDRNLTTHTYDVELAKQVVERIKDRYLKAFEVLNQEISSSGS